MPISISAFGGAALRDANVTRVQDLIRLVPTFKFADGPGTVAARFNIRGLGSFGNSAIEPSVATFMDGIYVPRAGALNSSLIDVQSVEVLSGPQGTLFGRNASVGALNITGALPTDELKVTAAAEAGTGERYRAELVANLPVSDRVAFRFAGLAEAFGGYWHQRPSNRRFGGLDTFSGRLTGRIELTPNVTWILRGDYTKQNGDNWNNISIVPSSITPTILQNYGRVLRGRLPIIGIESNDSLNDVSTADVDDYHYGVSSTLTLTTASDFSFKLINSYRHWKAHEIDGEITFTPVPIFHTDTAYESRSHNHELQFISPQNRLLGGRLSFVSGLYYFREKFNLNKFYNLRSEYCSTAVANFAPALVGPCDAGVKQNAFYFLFPQTTESYAGYAQATLKLLPRLELTLGGRYTKETKGATYTGARINPAAVFGTNESTTLRYSDSRFTERVNLTWKPQNDILLFGTFSTGFKAGGFNSGASNAVLGQLRNFGPETVKNYELGAKTQFLDRALTANVTLYRMDVKGFQERALLSATSVVRNVGDIRSQGVEATFAAAPADWLRLNASVAYLDAKFTSYANAPRPPWLTGSQDLSGTRPTYTPKWSTAFGAELRHDIGSGYRGTLRADVSTVSRANINATNDNGPLTFQDGYALLSARLSLFGPGDRYTLALFGQNLTNRHYCVNEGYIVFGPQLGALDVAGQSHAVTCFHGNPRTIGVRLGASF